MYKLLIILLMLCPSANIIASVTDENQLLIQATNHYLQSLPDISSDTHFKISIPQAAQKNNHCKNLNFSIINRNNQGRSLRLEVLCDDPDSWHSIFTANVISPKKYFVAAHDLDIGTVISDSDITVLHEYNALLSTAIISEKEKILGLTVTHPIQINKFFLRSDLKPSRGLMIGQTIKIISRGKGFQIFNKGKLLNNPSNGQFARVETSSKKLVTGVVEGTTVVDILN